MGLRSDFNLAARGLMVVLLDKLKDKNRGVVDGVLSTLDIFLLVRVCSYPCACVSFVVCVCLFLS